MRSLQRADRAVGAEERRQHRLTTHLDLRHLLSQPLRESTSSHTPFTTSMSAHFTSSGAFNRVDREAGLAEGHACLQHGKGERAQRRADGGRRQRWRWLLSRLLFCSMDLRWMSRIDPTA